MKTQSVLLAIALTLSLAACASGEPTDGRGPVETTGRGVKATGLCSAGSAEVAQYLHFASVADIHTLDVFCGLDSDAAGQLIRKRPSGGFQCLEELASVAQIGTGALQQLLFCGQREGEISTNLLAVFDQDIDGRVDTVLSFDIDQAQETVAMASGATQAELEAIDGIGPATAQTIIAARPVLSIFALRNLSGIGLVRLTALRDAAAAWEPTVPPVVDPPVGGDFVLTAALASQLAEQAVTSFMTSEGASLWSDHGYWAFGGQAYTDSFSQNFFLGRMESFLREDTELAATDLVGQGFADEAAALQAISALVGQLLEDNLHMYLEAYGYHILEYTA